MKNIMHYLEYFDKKIITYDLINKFLYKNVKNLPKLKKLILHFGYDSLKFKRLASSFLALELITNKKGRFSTAKKSNVLVKIWKGNPVGCKVLLTNKSSYIFLTRFLNEIWPSIVLFSKKKKIKELKVKKKSKGINYYYYRINNPLVFFELEENFYLFKQLNSLDMFLVVDSVIKNDSKFFISSFNLPKNIN